MDSRPPDYYEDDNDHLPSGGNSAAVRLLTSMEEPLPESRPYVLPVFQVPSPKSLVPPPLALQKNKQAVLLLGSTHTASPSVSTPEHFANLKKQEDGPTPRFISYAETDFPGPDSPHRKPVVKVQRTSTVKLQKKKKKNKAAQIAEAEVLAALPTIPEGPSLRRSSLRASKTSSVHGPLTTEPKIPNDESSHQFPNSVRPSPRRSYQPSVNSLDSSFLDPPHLPPPTQSYYQPRETGSPTRPWSRMSGQSDYRRPPASSVHYERADINGSPRPGTPSSQYGGSPRRPLPPAPLFSNSARNSSFVDDDATVTIPLDPDNDDVFGADGDMGNQRDSYGAQSQATLSDEAGTSYDEKMDHYGPAPNGMQERRGVREPQMAKKAVQLINGELVLECKIPTILYSFLPRRDEIEFTHMRYTAVTCDPDDFVDKGYKLRQNIGKTARETELFICVTMYNEDEIGFTRTMHAVMKNISHFCSRNKSRTWGERGWQKIVVAIVSDGREKIHPRTLDALAAMGVYQHGIAKNYVNQKAVQAHVYEYTTQVSLDADLKFKGAEKGIVPCQMIFCLKEKNQKKLNSHRWFFNALGRALVPNVCILLDVGTKPGGNSLYHLWKAFDQDSNVAGACGEIKAMKGKWGSSLLNPLVASQNFEYKMSNILDKPLESVFGYITVLPGALSAYRYHALQNDETGHGPLSQYFKGETLHGQHADVFTANMYLAEDRILCWELVAKRNERWVLKYVKGCTGETDVPGKIKFLYIAKT